jgi:hypothetical protein
MRHHTGIHPAAAAGTGFSPTERTSAKIRDGIAAWMLHTLHCSVLTSLHGVFDSDLYDLGLLDLNP